MQVLCIQDILCLEISEFKRLLSKPNCSKMIQNLEEKHLSLFKIIKV